jgi:hypothetical protein
MGIPGGRPICGAVPIAAVMFPRGPILGIDERPLHRELATAAHLPAAVVADRKRLAATVNVRAALDQRPMAMTLVTSPALGSSGRTIRGMAKWGTFQGTKVHRRKPRV